MRTGDGEPLAERWIEFGRYYESRDPSRFRVPGRAGLAEWFETRIDGSDGLWLVAERSGEIVGFLEADVSPAPDDAQRLLMHEMAAPVLRIHTLFVTATARGGGIGRSLMLTAETWGRQRGAASAAVIAIADGPLAVPFYRDTMSYRENTIGFWKPL